MDFSPSDKSSAGETYVELFGSNSYSANNLCFESQKFPPLSFSSPCKATRNEKRNFVQRQGLKRKTAWPEEVNDLFGKRSVGQLRDEPLWRKQEARQDCSDRVASEDGGLKFCQYDEVCGGGRPAYPKQISKPSLGLPMKCSFVALVV